MYSNSIGVAKMNTSFAKTSTSGSKMDPAMMSSVSESSQYPKKLTYVLSALKIAVGCGLVFLGCLAIYQKAAYGRTASGLWTGIIVIISGVLGVASAKMNASRIYVLLFFISCVIALITDVLVIIYSATGLASDSGFPGGFVRDQHTDELIPVSLVNFPAREKAMLINLLLIVTGVLEVMLTLSCSIICLRDVCECYGPIDPSLLRSNANYQRRARNDWLMSWLGQQNQIYFSGASGVPYTKFQTYHHVHRHPYFGATTPPYLILPSEPSRQSSRHSHKHRQSPRESHRSSSKNISPQPSGSSTRKGVMTPLEVYSTPYFYPAYPSPSSNISHPSMAPLVPVHTPSPPHFMSYGPRVRAMPRHHHRRPHHASARTRGHARSRSRDERLGRKRLPPSNPSNNNNNNRVTDSDLDKTYTGLDRELAEEFIEQTMDPAIVLDRRKNETRATLVSGTESDAW